jgi:hypothetical protein
MQEIIQECIHNPIRVNLFPSTYTAKLNNVFPAMDDALRAMNIQSASIGRSTNASVKNISSQMEGLSRDFATLNIQIQKSNQQLVETIKSALSQGNTGKLMDIATLNNLQDIETLKLALTENEKIYEAELRTVKDASYRNELQMALELSRLIANTNHANSSTLTSSISQLPQEFLCPISHGVMIDPVIFVQSGHTYERENLDRWIRGKGKSVDPLSGVEYKECVMTPNFALKSLINARNATHKASGWSHIYLLSFSPTALFTFLFLSEYIFGSFLQRPQQAVVAEEEEEEEEVVSVKHHSIRLLDSYLKSQHCIHVLIMC